MASDKFEFKVERHSSIDKSFKIFGPNSDDEFITIAYDDVWHEQIDMMAQTIVDILNEPKNLLRIITELKKLEQRQEDEE